MKIKRLSKVLIPAVCLLLLFSSCAEKTETEKKSSEDITFYYLNQMKTGLFPVEKRVKGKDTDEKVAFALDALSEVVSDNDYTNPIPDSVTIRTYSLKGNQLTISFSRDYETLSKVSEALLRAAVVKTLVQLDGIYSVSFRIVKETLVDSAGNAIGAMTADSFVDDFDFEQDSTKAARLTVYCPAKDGSGLIRETRNVHINENVPMAQSVVNQLFKTPDSGNAEAALPASVNVLSVNVNDGICYVNLDSVPESIEGKVSEYLRLYSVVDSLCELDMISRVQIISGSGDSASVINDENDNSTFSPNPDIVISGS